MAHIEGISREQVMMMSLEDFVTEDSFARVIDGFVEGIQLEELSFDHVRTSKEGRPPYHPGDLLKVVLYCPYKGIFSSYRLSDACKYNLEVKWLAHGVTPCAKTFSEFRRRNGEGIAQVFEKLTEILAQCDLLDGELVAQDSFKVDAQNSKSRNYTQGTLEKRREYLQGVVDEYEKALAQESDTDTDEAQSDGEAEVTVEVTAEETREEMEEKVASYREKIKECERLQAELEASGQSQLSLTDPEARRMPTATGGMEISYNVQACADAKHSLIVGYDVINHSDAGELSRMGEVVKRNLHVDHITMLADKGYNSATDLLRCEKQGVRVQISAKDGYDICVECPAEEAVMPTEHKRGMCVYLEERNVVLCPMGQVLKPSSYRERDKAMRFRNAKACKACTCRCVKRGVKEFEVKMTREQGARSPNVENLYVKQHRFEFDPELTKRRKCIIEHIFGTIKHGWGARQFQTRGLKNVRIEAGIWFIAYNLLRARNVLGSPKFLAALRARARKGLSFLLSAGFMGVMGRFWGLYAPTRPLNILPLFFCVFGT